MAPLQGSLDQENEALIRETHDTLKAMNISDAKILKQLNGLFGHRKVESALNGA